MAKEGEEDDLIDIKEFRRLMEDTFKPLNLTITEEMVQWNFDKIDTDHSGRISFDEYMTFIKKYNSWLLNHIKPTPSLYYVLFEFLVVVAFEPFSGLQSFLAGPAGCWLFFSFFPQLLFSIFLYEF